MEILISTSALQASTGPQWSPLAEADMALAQQEINQMIVAFLLPLCSCDALNWLLFIGCVDCCEVNNRNTEMCLWLLSKGASPDTPDRRTRTPLYHAVP